MRIDALHIYPLKGARGVSVESCELEAEGLAGDRRWMLVDEAGRFVSQREMATLALLDVHPDADGLHLSHPGGGERFVARPDGSERLAVRIWRDDVDAALCAPEDSVALSRWFERPLRLVYFDDTSRRSVDRDFVDRDTGVAFADGFPLLVTLRESLRALNAAIVTEGGDAVPMNRFRPNIVVSDAPAFADDGWAEIAVGGAVIELAKPCARCVVTTIDQDHGKRDGGEPLATLARTRRSADARAPGALFGWNGVPRGTGSIKIGDAVRVTAARSDPWPMRAA